MMMLTGSTHTTEHSAHTAQKKKTILVYSADLNFCFSISMVLQNKYNVITTTNCELMEKFAADYSAQLVIVDASPSQTLLECLREVKKHNDKLPIILLYVYSPKDAAIDNVIRHEVDSVFYKPFDLTAMSKRISELLPA
jgi:DNA-binding NtrC family response regulator